VDLNEQQQKMCSESTWDFSALFINCTLKKSPELSPSNEITSALLSRRPAAAKNIGAVMMLRSSLPESIPKVSINKATMRKLWISIDLLRRCRTERPAG